MKRHCYVFTLNNPKHQDYSLLGDASTLRDLGVDFVGYGVESGKKKDTLHLQGVLIMTRPITIRGLKKKLLASAHFEEMRGTFDQAIEYCKKDGEYVQLYTCDASQVEKRVESDAWSILKNSENKELKDEVVGLRKEVRTLAKTVKELLQVLSDADYRYDKIMHMANPSLTQAENFSYNNRKEENHPEGGKGVGPVLPNPPESIPLTEIS